MCLLAALVTPYALYIIHHGMRHCSRFILSVIYRDTIDKISLVFISEVRQALEAVGLPYKDFAGHSFRIGAAKRWPGRLCYSHLRKVKQ